MRNCGGERDRRDERLYTVLSAGECSLLWYMLYRAAVLAAAAAFSTDRASRPESSCNVRLCERSGLAERERAGEGEREGERRDDAEAPVVGDLPVTCRKSMYLRIAGLWLSVVVKSVERPGEAERAVRFCSCSYLYECLVCDDFRLEVLLLRTVGETGS